MKTKDCIYECANKRNMVLQNFYEYVVRTVINVAEEYGLSYEILTEIDERAKRDYYTHYNLFDVLFKRCGTLSSITYPEKYLKNCAGWDIDSIYGFFRCGRYVRKFRINTKPIRIGIGTDIIDRQVQEHAKGLIECIKRGK